MLPWRIKISPEEKLANVLTRRENSKKRRDAFYIQVCRSIQTTTKQLIWLFSINGVLWIWCSYILAFMGREQIAEALSSNVCTVVIGQMAMYVISKTVENVFKYNDKLGGRSNEAALNREGIKNEQSAVPTIPTVNINNFNTAADGASNPDISVPDTVPGPTEPEPGPAVDASCLD